MKLSKSANYVMPRVRPIFLSVPKRVESNAGDVMGNKRKVRTNKQAKKNNIADFQRAVNFGSWKSFLVFLLLLQQLLK